MKKTVLSGIRPTGKLHLGNYLGAISKWIELQEEYECYFFIADYHSLTTSYDNIGDLKGNIKNLIIDLIACGLDYEKASIFIQSHIKEHLELFAIFSMITPLAWLERNPTYKDLMANLENSKKYQTFGFLGYPVLQAADILIYNADYVPVGNDQLPHLELTREISRRFNFLYKNIFKEPDAILNRVSKLPGLDGRKMSKSYNNCIYISDEEGQIRKKIMQMKTDTQKIRKNDKGHPDVCSVYKYVDFFMPKRKDDVCEACSSGIRGCVECKKELQEYVLDYLRPISEKRKELIGKDNIIEKVLEKGTAKAKEKAKKTMEQVRKIINFY